MVSQQMCGHLKLSLLHFPALSHSDPTSPLTRSFGSAVANLGIQWNPWEILGSESVSLSKKILEFNYNHPSLALEITVIDCIFNQMTR